MGASHPVYVVYVSRSAEGQRTVPSPVQDLVKVNLGGRNVFQFLGAGATIGCRDNAPAYQGNRDTVLTLSLFPWAYLAQTQTQTGQTNPRPNTIRQKRVKAKCKGPPSPGWTHRPPSLGYPLKQKCCAGAHRCSPPCDSLCPAFQES